METDVLTWLEGTGTCGEIAVREESDESRPSAELISSISSGSLPLLLLQRINRLQVTSTQSQSESTPDPALKKLVEAATGNQKLRGKLWTALGTAMENAGVKLDGFSAQDVGKGSEEAVLSLLKSFRNREDELANSASKSAKPKDGIYLDSLDTEKALFQSDSCIEFLLLSFCSCFSVSPKQAAGLLAQNNKFLARIILKGLKGDFEPVSNWYQNVYQNTERLCDLMANERERNSLEFVLTCLKPGLEGKHLEVTQWCLKTYTKISLDVEERGLSPQLWIWYLHPSKGAFSSIVSLIRQKSPQLSSLAVEMMLHMAQLNMVECFSLHLKNSVKETNEYFAVVMEILPMAREMEWATEAIVSSRILNYWVESASREADSPNSKSRATSLQFLAYIWTNFFLPSDEAESMLSPLLASLKKAFRDQSLLLKSTAVGLMMDMLDTLAEAKSNFAPVIYKTLTILFMETEPVEEIRELLTYNFRRLLLSTPLIPVGILVEPLCKRVSRIQMQVNDGNFPVQMADFDLFVTLTKHSKLVVKNAIQLIDIMGKIYLSDMVYSKAALKPFSSLVTRFLDSEPMQEYLIAFVKVGLSQVISAERTRKDKKAKFDKYLSYATEENRQEILLLRRKRDVVFEMTEWILQLEQESLNLRLKDVIIDAHLDFRQATNTDCKGIFILLRAFGDPLMVINSYLAVKVPSVVDGELKHKSEFISPGSDLHQDRTIVPYHKTVAEPQKRGFPWKRAFADIEQAKRKAKERGERAREEEEMAKRRLENKQGKIALQLEFRKVEQAVGRSGGSEVAVFSEGLAAKFLTPIDELSLKEFTAEEKDDQDAVSLVLKRNSRVFKVLFQKYAGTGFARKKEAAMAFDWLAERKNRMFDTEYIKLFADHNIVPRLITKEEIRGVMKAYCHRIAHQSELNWVDFDGFIGCFCQYAYFIYGREPQDLSYLQPVVSVKTLIETLRRETKANGHSTEVFDDPDPGTGDKDVVKQLTKLLADNPDTPLPTGYKRIADQDISITFSVPTLLDIPPAFSAALEAVDRALFDGLGIHVLEPRISYFTVYRAKGVSQKKERVELPPIHERPPSLLKRKIKEYISDERPREKAKLAPIHLGPVLKFQIAHCSEEDRARVKECAELLEDMLHSLSLKMNRVIVREASKGRTGKTVTPGPAMEDKKTGKKVESEKMKEKRRQRQLAVAEQLAKVIAEREKQKADKEAAEIQQREREKQKGKLLAAKMKREREMRTQILKEVTEKKEEETRKKRDEEQKTKAVEDEKSRKTKEELKKKMHERLKEVLMKKQEEGRAKKPTIAANPSLTNELAESKKRFDKFLKEDRKRLDIQERKKEEFRLFAESPEVRTVLEKYEKHLETVFGFYCKQSLTRLEQIPDGLLNEMKLADFVKFLSQFYVTPNLVQNEVAVMTFNSLIKLKLRNLGVPATLTYSEFLLALLRLADESRAKLNLLSDSGESSNELRHALIVNQIAKEKANGGEVLTARTLTTLMTWLDFNAPLRDLNEKLKATQNMTKNPRKNGVFPVSASVESLRPEDFHSTRFFRPVHDSPVRMSQPEISRKPSSPQRYAL